MIISKQKKSNFLHYGTTHVPTLVLLRNGEEAITEWEEDNGGTFRLVGMHATHSVPPISILHADHHLQYYWSITQKSHKSCYSQVFDIMNLVSGSRLVGGNGPGVVTKVGM